MKNDLRELIQEKHKEAENHRFAKYLFSGDIDTEVYADYLLNQYQIYNALETRAKELGILEGLEDIVRANRIMQDFLELRTANANKYLATIEYVKYIMYCKAEDIMAHIYVRHFGDMYGGSMLQKKVPGSGVMYDFDNKVELIKKVREKLTPEMANESNKVFKFAIDLFEELAIEHNIQ